MIQYDRKELDHIAREHGFTRDAYEKVMRLANILLFINNTAYLCKHLVLKGGTAINLTLFNITLSS